MLNLLKREKRYEIRKEYFRRLANVSILVLIISLVYYGVLLFSGTFLINFEKQAVELESQNIANSDLQKQVTEYEKTLNHIKIEYGIFSKKVMSPTFILAKLSEKTIAGIGLEAINLNKTNEDNVFNVEVRGVAKNRDILLAYSNSLQVESIFEGINIPLSSLTKNTDIPFTISMTAKTNKENEK